jgi:hypothetical protein
MAKLIVAMVDTKERHYGVYADYGQYLIPFDHATIQMHINMIEQYYCDKCKGTTLGVNYCDNPYCPDDPN